MAFRVRHLAAGLGTLVLAGAAAAQPTDVRRSTTTTTTTEVQKASVVMNANVIVEGGATVGRITDFVISDGGCIDFVVVGVEEKFVLVPFQVVRVDVGQRVVHVNVTREKFREIPTFTGTNWPVTDQHYISQVRTVFGVRESGFRGDRREGDRRPMGPGEDRREDRRDDRRDNRGDRRDQPQPPPQRRDVENPNRPGTNPPSTTPPATRPGDRPQPQPPDRDRPATPPERPQPPDRDRPRTPPPPPPGTPGTNPNPPGTDRPPA